MSDKHELRALILCGGKGERLWPLTEEIPKPLIPIKGVPLLFYIVEHLKKYAINELIIASGYKSQQIKDHFTNNRNVTIVDSGDVDIIARLRGAKEHIAGDFLLLYGDTLSDVNVDELIQFHRSRTEKVTMTVWPLRSLFGVVDVSPDGTINSFKEKPFLDKWINIGYFYFDHESFALMEGVDRFEDFLRVLVAKGEINAYRHPGIHITVNTVQELKEAEEKISGIL